MRGNKPVFDTVAGFEFLGGYGIPVNEGTPQPILDKLNNVLARAVGNADISERLLATGIDPVGSRPAEFATFVRNESAGFAKILKE